jgi:PDZ domain-containing secreted protein
VIKKISLLLVLLALLLPHELGPHGESVKITNNLNLLVVRSGPVNNMMLLSERAGIKIPWDKSTDRYKQNADAYGMAQRYLGKPAIDGLYLTVNKDSKAYATGLRSGDILSNIKFQKPCKFQEKNILADWFNTYACVSDVTISRGDDFTKLTLPAGSNMGASGLRILTDHSPPPPKVTNQDTGLSGGLVLSLYYLDKETKGSLFSKDKVAATGMISPTNLEFSAISELSKKYTAAVENKNTLLLLADDQPLDELSKIKSNPNITIKKIKNLEQAVKILCNRGADDELCKKNNKYALNG